MKKFYRTIIKLRIPIFIIFILSAMFCGYLRTQVGVNYDMNDYLPEDTASTIALDKMQEIFKSDIPNARVMVKDVNIKEALKYKEKIEKVDGVEDVTWLDDYADVYIPLNVYNTNTVETYYKDKNALYTVTIEDDKRTEAVNDIRKIIGDDNCMTGSAVSTAVATESTLSEISKISVIAVAFTFFVLMLTTESWIEPIIVLAGIGVAVLLNSGTNIIFGTISFVTNAAGNILQLAVSLDYSVFLIHRFEECRKQLEPKEAMEEALIKSTSSILSSGLTTVIGFAALILMQFRIGPDMGLALAKGIAISLITVFVFMPGFILITYKGLEKTKHKDFLPTFRNFGNKVTKIMVPLACIFALIAVPCNLISQHNSFYFGSSHIFSTGTTYGDDTAEIRKLFGTNDTYVVIIPDGDDKTETKLVEQLEDIDHVKTVTSLATVVGPGIPRDFFPSTITSQLESDNYRRIVVNVNADYEGDETYDLIEKIRAISHKYYGDGYYLAGEGVSTYDLKTTITSDMKKVNFIAIAAVFIVLALTLKSIVLPIILVLTIETAIWINFSIPVLIGKTVFYISYLIISSIQLGATVDYAILFTERYKENRRSFDKKEAVVETISNCTGSILTSGTTLTVVGLLLGIISSHGVLSQLGTFLGIGTMFSMFMVLIVLPGLLTAFDSFFMKKKG